MRDVDDAETFIVELGAALVRSGTPTYEVENTLEGLGALIGLEHLQVSALPTMIFVEDRADPERGVRMSTIRSPGYELGRLADLNSMIDAMHSGVTDLDTARRQLVEIMHTRARYRWPIRALGSGVLSAGFALILQPSLLGLGVAAVLGVVVGLLLLVPRPEFQSLVPVIGPFIVTLIVLGAGDVLTDANPVRMIAAPLLLILPGAMITTGTMELAAGQTVSGSSRLIQGLVVLLLMAIGTVLAAVVVGVPDGHLLDRPVDQIGPAWSLLALVLLAVGFHLFMSAPAVAVPWILVVLIIAYGAQRLSALVVPDELSAFFGALAMTPAVHAISRWRRGLPQMLLFLPAFLLLVPGAAGFIGVTELVGADRSVGAQAFQNTLVTVIAITLGVLIGSILMSPRRRRAGAIANL